MTAREQSRLSDRRGEDRTNGRFRQLRSRTREFPRRTPPVVRFKVKVAARAIRLRVPGTRRVPQTNSRAIFDAVSTSSPVALRTYASRTLHAGGCVRTRSLCTLRSRPARNSRMSVAVRKRSRGALNCSTPRPFMHPNCTLRRSV